MLALPLRKTCRAFASSCILSLDSPRIAVQSCPFFLWHGHVLLGYGSVFRCIVPCGVWFLSLLMSVELSCLCLFSGVFSSSCSAAVLLSASRLCSLSRRVFRASGLSSSSSMSISLHHWFVSDSDIPVAALRRLCVLHFFSISLCFFLQHGCSYLHALVFCAFWSASYVSMVVLVFCSCLFSLVCQSAVLAFFTSAVSSSGLSDFSFAPELS